MGYQGEHEHVDGVQRYRLAKAIAKDRNCMEEHPCTDELGAQLSSLVITQELLHEMNKSLASGNESELIYVTAVTVERTFVYFDVSDFSKHPPAHVGLAVRLGDHLERGLVDDLGGQWGLRLHPLPHCSTI
jgi:hypothetical protein